jgi:hypothetical protein
MRSRRASFILKQNFAAVLPEFRLPGCDEIFITFCFGSLLAFTGTFKGAFIAKPAANFVWETHKIFPVFDFTAHFYINQRTQVVMISLQLFGIQKPTSQGMAKPCDGKSGVIKLTAKPASVLANKPQ